MNANHVGETFLGCVDYEKDIGIFVHSNLKPSLQISEDSWTTSEMYYIL